jgi:hypothetical protein
MKEDSDEAIQKWYPETVLKGEDYRKKPSIEEMIWRFSAFAMSCRVQSTCIFLAQVLRMNFASRKCCNARPFFQIIRNFC